jgi:hypothetical protein
VKRLSHHGPRDAEPVGENEFGRQSSLIVEFSAADQFGDLGRQMLPQNAEVVLASPDFRPRPQKRVQAV